MTREAVEAIIMVMTSELKLVCSIIVLQTARYPAACLDGLIGSSKLNNNNNTCLSNYYSY